MIISHSRRFIFVKTTKTGGTSLELALSKYCGPEDIITPVLPEEEPLREKIGGKGPQNFEVPLGEANVRQQIRQLILQRKPKEKFSEHLPAQKIRDRIPDAVWRDYFKFTIVRHPYDRIVSSFYFARKMIPRLKLDLYYDLDDLDQYLRYRAGDINHNWHLYTENDELLVDHVVRLERLEEDLARVSKEIGLEHNLHEDMTSIVTKSNFRPKESRKQNPLNAEQRALIDTLCTKEMALCGYTSDGIG